MMATKGGAMALSEERRDSLRLLYESWGADKVRAELANEETRALLPKDIVAYAQHWLAEQEIKRQHMLALCRRSVAVGLILFLCAVAVLLIR
jgi:hypothetical protein